MHRYLVVGGGDKRLHVWDPRSQQYVRALGGASGHKDIVTGVAFRDGTHELFSCGVDRAVKLWSLDDMAYVDTLFGHQSEVVDRRIVIRAFIITLLHLQQELLQTLTWTTWHQYGIASSVQAICHVAASIHFK